MLGFTAEYFYNLLAQLFWISAHCVLWLKYCPSCNTFSFFFTKNFHGQKITILKKFYSSQDLRILKSILHQAEEHIPELGHEFTYSRNALLLLDFKKILVIWLDAVLSARVLQNFKLPTLENRCQSYGNWPLDGSQQTIKVVLMPVFS